MNPYGDPPDYTGGCGPNALWATCPPTPAPPSDADGDGYTAAAGDCNDGNRDVHPDAAETCNDRDDDCNGTADDPWHAGLTQDLGNPCTVGVGACTNTGDYVCARDGRATVCSVDAGRPSPERCNGIDDDCDGETDEDWRVGLAQDLGNPCAITWDACRGSTNGTWICAPDGRATVCNAPEPPPLPLETCNGLDDDCNGVIDDLASVIIDPSTTPRNHPSLIWNADREQFVLVWAEQMLHFNEYGFGLRARSLDAFGAPVGNIHNLTSVIRSSSLGIGIGWHGSGYGIAWLVATSEEIESEYELLFTAMDSDGFPTGLTTTIAGPWSYTRSSTPFPASPVHIAVHDGRFTIGVYTPNFTVSDAGDILLLRVTSTGEIIGGPFSILDPYGIEIIRQEQFALTLIDGQEVAAWVEGHPSGVGYPSFIAGTWLDQIGSRRLLEPNYMGLRFGIGITCLDLRSCHILSFRSLLDEFYWSELYAFDARDGVVPTLQIPSIPTQWGSFEDAVVACMRTMCSIAAISALDNNPNAAQVALASLRIGDSAIVHHRTLSMADRRSRIAVRQGKDRAIAVWSATDGKLYATPWCAMSE